MREKSRNYENLQNQHYSLESIILNIFTLLDYGLMNGASKSDLT